MPNYKVPISTSMREALVECYRSAARLIRDEWRDQLVLRTEDVDVVAPEHVLVDLWDGVSAGTDRFGIEPDGKIAFDAPQGFRVRMDIIKISDGCIDRIYETIPFYEGSVASVPDLLRLRAATVVDRGPTSENDVEDWKWLLSQTAVAGQMLPVLSDEELADITQAGKCLGVLDRLVLVAVLGLNTEAALGLL
ncbi:hypothetical protein F4777DRAFT_592210 [Nemania sp. FL0916]|nr:hypothetical protein F4777DRAFT_592210 [Nemania sp. FL0916]